MSNTFASAMSMDDEDEYPNTNVTSGFSNGQPSDGNCQKRRGPKNKGKNASRGGEKQQKPIPFPRVKGHTPTPPLEDNFHSDPAQGHTNLEPERNIDTTILTSPLDTKVENKWDTDTTSDEQFVTANNSADETHNYNGNSSRSNGGEVFNSKNWKTEEDKINLNTSSVQNNYNESYLAQGDVSVAHTKLQNETLNPESNTSMQIEEEEEDDNSSFADASLAVHLSDTAGDTLNNFPSFTESSLSSSPLSSSRSAPPDLSNTQDSYGAMQNATDSIIYQNPNQFQTSTPIVAVSNSDTKRRNDESARMSFISERPSGWDNNSTIYAEEPTNVVRANMGFLVDDSAQENNLGFVTTRESGICDMSSTSAKDSTVKEDEENSPEIQVIKEVAAPERVSKFDTPKKIGGFKEIPVIQLSSDDEEIQEVKEVKVPIPVPKSVTFQNPSSQNDSASDADEEVEEINQPFLLPSTVTELTADNGVKVYLVGTAHFSRQSQLDVIDTIEKVQPTSVVLELCHSRSGMLTMNEEQILQEAANMSLDKIRSTIRQSGAVQGCLHLLLLSMTASLTKKLGMAPGGEFRVALKEAQKIPFCAVHLGDRNLSITLSRALSGLGVFQKCKLAWHFLRASDYDITKEEVEACKEKDLLEKLLEEMAGEFPLITRVLLDERDLYLSHSLWLAAISPRVDWYGHTEANKGPIVGVVGMGHVAGIVKNWGKVSEEKIAEILLIPEPSSSSLIIRKAVKVSFYCLVGYGFYKGSRKLFNFPSDNLIKSIVGSAVMNFQKITPTRFTGKW